MLMANPRAFDGGERAEMAAALQGEGVALGDRSKLRRLVDETLGLYDPPGKGGIRDSTAQSDGLRRAQDTDCSEAQSVGMGGEGPAQGGSSMDTIALALTAVLGILSYLMQAKIQRDAERTEKAREQAHSDNVRAEARAAQLLARVQNQMQHYVRPLIQSHVSLSAFTDHFRRIYPYGSGSTAMTPSVVSLQPLV